MNTLQNYRPWAAVLLLWLLLLGLVACGPTQTAGPETLPAFSGPALLFFYTDG